MAVDCWNSCFSLSLAAVVVVNVRLLRDDDVVTRQSLRDHAERVAVCSFIDAFGDSCKKARESNGSMSMSNAIGACSAASTPTVDKTPPPKYYEMRWRLGARPSLGWFLKLLFQRHWLVRDVPLMREGGNYINTRQNITARQRVYFTRCCALINTSGSLIVSLQEYVTT